MNDKLFEAWAYCDELDKSTEFMLQYMQDTCKVDLDCVLAYMQLPDKEHKRLFDEVIDFVELFTIIDK